MKITKEQIKQVFELQRKHCKKYHETFGMETCHRCELDIYCNDEPPAYLNDKDLDYLADILLKSEESGVEL